MQQRGTVSEMDTIHALSQFTIKMVLSKNS